MHASGCALHSCLRQSLQQCSVCQFLRWNVHYANMVPSDAWQSYGKGCSSHSVVFGCLAGAWPSSRDPAELTQVGETVCIVWSCCVFVMHGEHGHHHYLVFHGLTHDTSPTYTAHGDKRYVVTRVVCVCVCAVVS